MPPTASLTDGPVDARAFAESIAGVLVRHGPSSPHWAPGEPTAPWPPELARALEELGWGTVARDRELVAFAGLGAVELGRRLAPLDYVDGLLGAGPIVGELARSLGSGRLGLLCERGAVVRRPVIRSEPVACVDGLDVQRVLELGDPRELGTDEWRTAVGAWTAATTGYLAGLGQAALDLTVDYARQRRAFGSTLAGLAPVQQLLADATTAVRGARLLAADGADGDALAHAGPAVAQACGACQQVTGAIGFTLEYPLHRCTQLARAIATWNDALLDCLIDGSG